MADILKTEQTLLTGSIPAIAGIDDPSQARMILYQAGRPVHAPMDSVGLLTEMEAEATYRLLSTAVFTNVKVTTFTASGTFTPDANMVCCEVWAWGGGGGGGGSAVTAAGQASMGAGGSAGAKAYLLATAATIGSSKTVTIGAGGGGNSGAAGSAGNVTTLGSLLSARGGEGGTVSGAGTLAAVLPNSAAQSATGTVRSWTTPGTSGNHGPSVTLVYSISGCNELGGSIPSTINAAGTAANANTGAGGGGTTNGASQGARTGGAGGSGLMIIKEYLKA